MTHKLANLLGEAGEKFSEEIAKFEAACGHPSHDVHFLSQSAQAARARMADLGLDPDDTTAEELYHSLRVRYQRDALQFEDDLGLKNADSEQKSNRLMEVASRMFEHETVWCLKPAELKASLKQLPPKKTAKVLGFRSLDSMLKRTNVAVILAVARLAESPSWQAKWQKITESKLASHHETSQLHIVTAVLPKPLEMITVPERATVVVASGSGPGELLGQVLRAVEGAQAITGKDYSRQLGSVSVSLRWWMSNLHLSAWINDQAISFNIYDIAAEEAANATFEQRSGVKAGAHIRQKLTQSYHQLMDDLALPVENISRPAKAHPVLVEAEVENV